MKKILLSAAAFAVVAVSAVAVAPTTSEAIPAFARQTGAACLSCHFQSFPTLNAFGRAFKQNALTDVGEQALVEDEALSIPSVLNATVVVRPNVVFSDSYANVKTKDIVYGDQVVLIGGRVGSNVGVFLEMDTAGGGFGNHQIFTSFDFGSFKAGLNYYNSGFGEDAGMQLMSVWGQHGGLMGGKNISINHRMSKAASALNFGFAAWAGNETATVQLGQIAAAVDQTGAPGLPSLKLATMVRAVGFFEAGGLELGLGGILTTGSIYDPNAALAVAAAKRWGIDFQAQGEFGDTQVGFYADYAQAAAGSLAKANVYNASLTNTRKGYSFRGTVKPTHNLVLMAGYGQDKTGNESIKSTLFGAEFEVYQNFVIALTYQSDKIASTTIYGANVNGTNKTTTLDIEMLM